MISDLFKFGFGALGLTLGLLGVIGLYKSFKKAGKPGILAFVPIVNLLNLIHMGGRPLWWIVLLLVPVVNVVVMGLVLIGVAQRFGKSALFGLGLLFFAPIGWLILGFGDAAYRGEAAT